MHDPQDVGLGRSPTRVRTVDLLLPIAAALGLGGIAVLLSGRQALAVTAVLQA